MAVSRVTLLTTRCSTTKSRMVSDWKIWAGEKDQRMTRSSPAPRRCTAAAIRGAAPSFTKESVQAVANPCSRNTTAREVCKSLITNKQIHISWIKAHVGYEEADRLAEEYAKSDKVPLFLKLRAPS
ncbi:hypothetical protein AVEN_72506-1 [Araneus ventricosus]|uniref:RNase H type-1 domain-containing protein n=1 Tax=Araneus ventricosus TaxID=182803 RepID=A0A4Y2G4D3_ARAVE|nr:hypothetical protein AVEN_72506-1 [Araneus ventricosus]